jgi:hypothetical protein
MAPDSACQPASLDAQGVPVVGNADFACFSVVSLQEVRGFPGLGHVFSKNLHPELEKFRLTVVGQRPSFFLR